MTRQLMCLLVTAVLVSADAVTAVDMRQNPPRDTRTAPPTVPPAPVGTASITGVVMNDDGSRPLRFAYVLLLGATTGLVKVSSTDADGRFTFAGLPADRYTVGASKPPYLGAIAGAKRPARPGTPIAVANGQKISNVAIRLPMSGSISGVVTDEKGEVGGTISVSLQQWRMQGGERSLVAVPGGNATVDDRGRYRLFGLPPGEYVVGAMKMGSPFIARPLSTDDVDAALRGASTAPWSSPRPTPPVRYAPAFYPGTTRASDAGTISLRAGEERTGVDFRVEMVPTARLDGAVTNNEGQPLGNAAVIIMSAGVLQTTSVVRVGPDGRFSVSGMLPGTYSLLVTGSGPNAGQFAQSSVDVAGADVLGVQLVMRPGMTIAGRLVFEGRGLTPSLAGRRVAVRPSRAAVPGVSGGLIGPQTSATNETGGFTITNVVPGRYLVGGPLSFGPTSETMTWSLQSVLADGRDVTDLPLDIAADSLPKNIVVTYTDRFQELSGRLQSQSGAPASDYTIIVFPEDKAYWIHGTRRIVTARPGTDGRFTLSGPGPTTLPPGRYLLAAVTDIGRDEQFDPAFLSELVSAGVPLVLGVGEKKVQDVAIK